MSTAFDCYEKYIAIKQHFKSDTYDYFKYSGKVRVSNASFTVRSDKVYFEKIARKLDKIEEVEKLYVSLLLEYEDFWAGNVFSDKYQTIYSTWKERVENFSYRFGEDVRKLSGVDSIFVCKGGQYAPLLRLTMRKEIMLETLIVMNEFTDICNAEKKQKIFDYWDTKIEDTMIWPQYKKRCLKYQPFLLRFLREPVQVYQKTYETIIGENGQSR